jgi:hypothetical protein
LDGYRPLHKKERGGVVNNQNAVFAEVVFTDHHQVFAEQQLFSEYQVLPEQQAFTTEDVLWALGIWSVILCFSPVIVFYMLMVA